MNKVLYFTLLLIALAACKQPNADVAIENNTQVTTQSERNNNSVMNNDAVTQAYRDKKSHVFVEGYGIVKKLLPEDNKGSRHQKFLVTISERQTLLFAHNIDLTQLIPLAVNDRIEFRGEYVYNPKGGIVHWTHHDPKGKIAGGWIKHNGTTYK